MKVVLALARAQQRATTFQAGVLAWLRRSDERGRMLARSAGRRLRSVGRLVTRCVLAVLPQIFYVLWLNAKVGESYTPSVNAERIRCAAVVDKDTSIALWQADNDRLNGLAAKAAGVLAADALVAAGIASQTESRGIALYACIACVAFLVSGSAAACAVQMPSARHAVLPEHVLEGHAERRMVEVVAANESLGIRLQNLAYIGVRDTFISLLILLLVLALNFWR